VLIAVLSTLVVLYLLLCWLLYAGQRSIVFPAPKTSRKPQGDGELVFVPGGTPLFFHPPPPNGPLVVYFHGNGEQIADNAWLAGFFGRAGVGFAAIEYPGYGLASSEGKPSERSILAAAERGLAYLLEDKSIPRDKLILAGQSLGTGVAMAMAERGFGAKILLFCPFTSLPDVGARVFPFLPVRLLLQDRFDSLARAPRIQIPALVLHGSADELIPVALGKTLTKSLSNGRFIEIAGGHHNDLWLFGDVEREALSFVRPN